MKQPKKSNDAILTRASSMAIGKSLRKTHPLEAHQLVKSRPKGFSSNLILEKSNEDRLLDLIPIRYGRMWSVHLHS